jgi:hypothetical protein
MTIDLNASTVDLTAPSTPIGSVTPVAVTSTIFTASPANNTSAFVTGTANSLTGANAQSLVDLSQTWNTTGTPSAIFLNVTDTASNANSKLIELQQNSINRFSVKKTGELLIRHITNGYNWELGSTGGVLTFKREGIGGGFGYIRNGGVYNNMAVTSSDAGYAFSSTTEPSTSVDIELRRDAAYTIGQRNGTNSQVYRLYKSFTDASNYTRSAWKFDANGIELATESAGTGDANIDITFTPKGTGNVRFGTHAALSGETVTGYITIKDSSGTLRKLAVVS